MTRHFMTSRLTSRLTSRMTSHLTSRLTSRKPRVRGVIAVSALAVGLLAAYAPTAALAASPAPDRAAERASDDAALNRLLDAIEWVPRSLAELEAALPNAEARLTALATDRSRGAGWRRIRALSLLSFFGNGSSRATLEELLADPEPEIRRLSVYTLGRTFGAAGRVDADVVDAVETALDDPATAVRDHAVRTLRWVDHPRADALLRTLRDGHPDAGLRRLAARTMSRRVARQQRGR